MGEPQITHWDGCWKDGPRHYECLREAFDRKWKLAVQASDDAARLSDELRAAREVVEAARTALWAGLHDPRMKAALAAYDAARNEQEAKS